MCHIHTARREREGEKERNNNNQKWFYYSVKWTTPIKQQKRKQNQKQKPKMQTKDEENVQQYFRFTTNWPKYKKENRKNARKWFLGYSIYCCELFAVALLTSNCIGFSYVCMCACVYFVCERLSVCMLRRHSLSVWIELRLVSNHFIIYIYLYNIFYTYRAHLFRIDVCLLVLGIRILSNLIHMLVVVQTYNELISVPIWAHFCHSILPIHSSS